MMHIGTKTKSYLIAAVFLLVEKFGMFTPHSCQQTIASSLHRGCTLFAVIDGESWKATGRLTRSSTSGGSGSQALDAIISSIFVSNAAYGTRSVGSSPCERGSAAWVIVEGVDVLVDTQHVVLVLL